MLGKKQTICVEIISYLFILLWLYAGLMKITDYSNFAHVLKSSPLIGWSAPITAILLPLSELILAVGLFYTPTRQKAMWATLILMTLFTIYTIYLFTFAPSVPCVCGGIISTFNWRQHLYFNCSLEILAIIGIWLMKHRIHTTDHIKFA